jgi:hypothetical protein
MFDELGNPVISTITVVIPPVELPKELVYSGDDPVEPVSPLLPALIVLSIFVALRSSRRVENR